MKETVETDNAPAAVGAYSQAATNGEILITAGQLPMTSDGELLDEASVARQTTQCLENIVAVLESEELRPTDILKTTVFLDDIEDFDSFNKAYSSFFDSDPPARSAVGVGVEAVPKGAAVEIEAIATVE
jgi:reactive intermediate/imine deaminase